MKIGSGKSIKNDLLAEAQFPIYRKLDAAFAEGECVIYTRVAEDMTFVQIRYCAPTDLTRMTYEVTFGTTELRLSENREYSLGLGEFASSEAEFHQVMENLQRGLKTHGEASGMISGEVV